MKPLAFIFYAIVIIIFLVTSIICLRRGIQTKGLSKNAFKVTITMIITTFIIVIIASYFLFSAILKI